MAVEKCERRNNSQLGVSPFGKDVWSPSQNFLKTSKSFDAAEQNVVKCTSIQVIALQSPAGPKTVL